MSQRSIRDRVILHHDMGAMEIDLTSMHFASNEEVDAFFDGEGRRHFAAEEDHLAPVLPADDEEWSTALARMLAEHEDLRRAAGGLAQAPDRVTAARALGELLDAHVRFEERVLFEILERRLSEERLGDLAAALRAADA